MDRTSELQSLSTFDLAFNIAMGKYNEQDKFIALSIIKGREDKTARVIKKADKPPLTGSKGEKILRYLNEGKTPAEVAKILKNKHRVTAYPAEVYRIKNKYMPEKLVDVS